MNEWEQHDLLIRIDENVKSTMKIVEDHDDRVRNLEDWRNYIVGAGILLSIINAALMLYLTWRLK